jgi:hypothetical protein
MKTLALLFLTLFSISSHAGNARLANEKTTTAAIPFWGNDASIFVSGLSCLKFPDPEAKDRCSAYKGCVDRGQDILRKKIEAEKNPNERIKLLHQLALLFANKPAQFSESIRLIDEAYRLATGNDQALANGLLATRGILELRLGEYANCNENHNADSCLFPLKGGAIHSKKEGALAAMKSFQSFLETEPDNEHIRWLLNIAAMAAGKHKLVPKQWFLPENIVGGTQKFPRFPDIGGAIGLQKKQTGGGSVLVDDINGDGLLDILLSPRLDCLGLIYLENDGKGAFTDKSESSGLSSQIGVTNAILADFDNNGTPDLYLMRGGWQERIEPRVYNSLLKNMGDGKFTDITQAAGLRTSWNASVSGNWVDFDQDGWIDLFVCNEGREVELFRNVEGKFQEQAKKLGINSKATCKGSAWGDVNGDHWPDLFIGNYASENKLYLNEAGKKFREDDQPLLKSEPTLVFTSMFFDFENDGDLDLFTVAYNRDTKEYVRFLLNKPFTGEASRLFLNDGKGKFTNAEVGLPKFTLGMGANYGDFNGDGWLDLYIGTGSISLGDLAPNIALLNNKGKVFSEITSSIGMGNLQKGHGVAFADVENRGRQDVAHILAGTFGGDTYYPSFYKNPGFQTRWLTLRLEGTKSNRSAIGAKIRVRFMENGRTREVFKQVGPGGSFGSNPLRAEFGLGKASRILEVEIRWPHHESPVSLLKNPPLDSILAVKEGQESFQRVAIKKLSLKRKAHKHHH